MRVKERFSPAAPWTPVYYIKQRVKLLLSSLILKLLSLRKLALFVPVPQDAETARATWDQVGRVKAKSEKVWVLVTRGAARGVWTAGSRGWGGENNDGGEMSNSGQEDAPALV